jgi:serine/threonine protein kinase
MKLCTYCNIHFDDGLETCPNEYSQLVYIGKKPLIGSLVGGRYKVISAVGAGSMGVVYRAQQISNGREMAIKVLHGTEGGPGSAHVRRFRREAKAVGALNHENIVRLFDFGFMDDGQPYIVTDFIEGKTLAQMVRERSRLSLSEAAPILKQVCSAVQEAHRLKIVHRDLKPENIILQEDDDSGKAKVKSGGQKFSVKVVDFGVAKLSSDANSSSASLTVEGKVCGSPGYMSPEQCKGLPVDIRSDIYSLGIVIYEVISGHRPFSADSVMGLLFMHVNEKPPPMNAFCLDLDVPFRLEQVIQKSLAKNPDDRQRTVAELWQEFEVAVASETKEAPKVTPKTSSNWIRFSGVENKFLQEEARKLAEEKDNDLRVLVAKHKALAYGSSENVKANRSRLPPWWLNKPIKVGMFIGAIAMVVVIELGWWPVHVSLKEGEVEQADTYIQRNQLPEALMAIERLKKQLHGSTDDMEELNSLYMSIGEKYAQKHDWASATESLQRIPARSKYYQAATQLFKKYRKQAATAASD